MRKYIFKLLNVPNAELLEAQASVCLKIPVLYIYAHDITRVWLVVQMRIISKILKAFSETIET